MESADLTRVIVRRKFYSQNTWGYYTQKPQFEYVGSVDLTEVENMKDLRRDLLDFGLTDGDYQLQTMTKKRGSKLLREKDC